MTTPRIYKPVLPPFQAEEGQCLPAAIAILFDRPEIIAAFLGKKYGYLLAEIGKMLPDGIGFDVLYADSKTRQGGMTAYYFAKNKLITDDFLPLFCQIGNHVVLYLINRHGHVYGFDLLKNRCGFVLHDRFKCSNIDAVVCLADSVTNSALGLSAEYLTHLLT